ncbi:MAG TPA: hypothetical protein VMB84_05520 [Stellaceae bacterium]|nr:hypothetical protein [Stellaceae bacterium]
MDRMPQLCASEVDFLARAVIAQHGAAAADAAERHLDQLSRADSARCETWSAVIDAIHAMRCRLGAASAAASGPDQVRELGWLGR